MAWSLLALSSTVKQGLHKELFFKEVNYFNLGKRVADETFSLVPNGYCGEKNLGS